MRVILNNDNPLDCPMVPLLSQINIERKKSCRVESINNPYSVIIFIKNSLSSSKVQEECNVLVVGKGNIVSPEETGSVT